MMRCIKFTKTESNDRSKYGCDCRVVISPENHFNDWMKDNPDVNIHFIHTGFNQDGYPVSIVVYYLEDTNEEIL